MTDDPTNVIDLKAKRRAQTAKGRARAKITNYKPATGNKGNKPASGMPASGLPAMGDTTGIISAHRGPDVPKRTRDAMKLASLAAMEAAIDDPEVPAVAKAMIAEKILNRLEGMPTQMTVTADMGDVSNLTADERAAEIADLERRLGRA